MRRPARATSVANVATVAMLGAAWISLLAAGCAEDVLPDHVIGACDVPPTWAVADQHPRADDLDATLRRSVARGIPGVALAVKGPGTLRWAGAAGSADIARDIALRSCHRSRIASISKTFAATAVLQLVDRGLLDLDAPLAGTLPASMLQPISNAPVATPRQLLQHTSGIFAYQENLNYGLDFLNDPLANHWTPERCLSYAHGQDAYFPVGTGFHYSNTNYVLLGALLEKVSGRSRFDVIREQILVPVGLDQTVFDATNPIPPNTVRGYADLFADGQLTETTDFAFGMQTLDGGMVSNVFDLITFMDALFEGGLISDAARADMMQLVPVGANDLDGKRGFRHYGLGLRTWDSDFGQALGHTGETWGYLGYAFSFGPARPRFAMIINGSYGRVDKLAQDLLNELAPILSGQE